MKKYKIKKSEMYGEKHTSYDNWESSHYIYKNLKCGIILPHEYPVKIIKPGNKKFKNKVL